MLNYLNNSNDWNNSTNAHMESLSYTRMKKVPEYWDENFYSVHIGEIHDYFVDLCKINLKHSSINAIHDIELKIIFFDDLIKQIASMMKIYTKSNRVYWDWLHFFAYHIESFGSFEPNFLQILVKKLKNTESQLEKIIDVSDVIPYFIFNYGRKENYNLAQLVK